MEIIDLPELGAGEILDPTEGERRALLATGRHLKLEWLSDGRVHVKPNGFVGSVRVSDERMLRVTTKVPIANVLELVSLAYRSMRVPVEVGRTLLDESQPLDWLTLLLISETEALLQRDLRHGYIELETELPYIRGRIQFHRQVATWSQPGLTPCRFSDFTPDTSENRVLRATLESLMTETLYPGLRDRVDALTRMLPNVTLGWLSRALFSSVRVTRLNQAYGPALELCRIYFEHRGVDDAAGRITAPAFFFPMAEVFEKAIGNFLAGRLPNVRVQTGGSLHAVAGEPAHTFAYTPDLVVGDPAQLVLDTKYSKAERVDAWGGLTYQNEHAYQLVFYGLAHGCPGILIYPRDDRDIDATYELNVQQFTFITVDLERDSLDGLPALAEAVRRRASQVRLEAPAPSP